MAYLHEIQFLAKNPYFGIIIYDIEKNKFFSDHNGSSTSNRRSYHLFDTYLSNTYDVPSSVLCAGEKILRHFQTVPGPREPTI